MSDQQPTTRREWLNKLVKSAGGFTAGMVVWGGFAGIAKNAPPVLRPPGAQDERSFLKACIKCGICVENCPYDTLKLATPGDSPLTGTPYFKPRDIPCYMCPDIPCVPDCPSGALDTALVSVTDEKGNDKLSIDKARMGVAVIDEDSCIAFWGIQCDACYRACPLMDEAVTLKRERVERTGRHAYLKPVVHRDKCTGCGMCEHACVTEKASIIILPRETVSGKTGNHYIKSWEEKDELKIRDIDVEKVTEEQKHILNYLDNWEGLLDDEK